MNGLGKGTRASNGKVVFLKKGFWLIFASFSTFHLVEDMFWALAARFTTIPMVVIIIGILLWAMATTIFVHTKAIKKHWSD
jgi:protein-S-isoprenylcysteine O-methyltransferase Ste14